MCPPGTYRIAGPETNYRTCGVCAYVETNLHRDSTARFDLATDYYWPRSGTPIVHAVNGRFSAELRDLELATGDGRCTSLIAAITIDAELAQNSID